MNHNNPPPSEAPNLLDLDIPPPFTPREEELYPWIRSWRDNPIFIAIYQHRSRRPFSWDQSTIPYIDFLTGILCLNLILIMNTIPLFRTNPQYGHILLFLFQIILTVLIFSKNQFRISIRGFPLSSRQFLRSQQFDKYLEIFLPIPNFEKHLAHGYVLEMFRNRNLSMLRLMIYFLLILGFAIFFGHRSRAIDVEGFSIFGIILALYTLVFLMYFPSFKSINFYCLLRNGENFSECLGPLNSDQKRENLKDSLFIPGDSKATFLQLLLCLGPVVLILIIRYFVTNITDSIFGGTIVLTFFDARINGNILISELVCISILILLAPFQKFIFTDPSPKFPDLAEYAAIQATKMINVGIQFSNGIIDSKYFFTRDGDKNE